MLLSDAVLQQRLAAEPWTAYNIRLTPAVTTLPGAPDFLRTDRRLLGILRTLAVLYRGDLTGLRVVDLGCLEGGFALALAQRGARVLAIDARQANLDKVRLLIEHFELGNLEVACADVKEFTRERYGDFDVVLCLGLLYHLDRPVAWLQQAAAVTRAVLIVDTHLAPDDDAIVDLDPRLACLGALERRDENESVTEGRWFQELSPAPDPLRGRWAAFSNAASFWLTRASLVGALRRAGFDAVFEQQDWIADAHAVYARNLARAMFVAVKTAAFAAAPVLSGIEGAVDLASVGGTVAGPPPFRPDSWPMLKRIDRSILGYLRRRRLGRCLAFYWQLRVRAASALFGRR